jgi:ferredoxin
MPKLTIEGYGTFESQLGERLTSAIDRATHDVLHRCGGNARCTTCRVEFISGEPLHMTVAEKNKLAEKGLAGNVRLSCQIHCLTDMHVRLLNPYKASGLSDAGPAIESEITPAPEWTTKY